ncbi:unnamed protein product [Sphagnum jensenii]|uniref:Uncharacterized protein n=1 Tax=Sphagnum jensenii TaxID=128206 RepID=A0ABP0VAH1_9BRYO
MGNPVAGPQPGIVGRQYGIDVSTAITAANAQCMATSQYNGFIVPRGYQSSGNVDTNVCTDIINAYNAQIPYRDAYIFPCPKCASTAAQQVSSLVSYLQSNCLTQWSGRVINIF